MKALWGSLSVLALSASVHAGEPAPAPFPCTAVAGIEPICGFARPPEDLEDLPGGAALLVSEYGALNGARPGQLSVLDLRTRARRLLFGGESPGAQTPPSRERDPCPGAPGARFSPHGIHLAQVNGKLRLLVVNHGGREAIEIFDVSAGRQAADVTLTWRDCVPAPAEAWLNDVVNLPDGGFAATHMVSRGTREDALLAAEASRAITGYVMQWHPDRGWAKVPGSDGGLPNGLEVAADGTTLYVNQYLGDRVIALDRLSGIRQWTAEVPAPDNLTISPAGELLVASHRAGLEAIIECAGHSERPCGAPYAVVALNPQTGAQRTVFTGEGAPLGGATVALQAGDRIYLGSFVGERVVVRSLVPPAQ